MAEEVFVFCTLRVISGHRRIEFSNKDRTGDLTSSDGYAAMGMIVGTTVAAVDFGAADSPTLAAFVITTEVDGAYIDLSLNADGSDSFCRLTSAAIPKELSRAFALIPLPGAGQTIYAVADSPGRSMEYFLVAVA